MIKTKTLKFVSAFALALIISVLMIMSGCTNKIIAATNVTMSSAENAVTINTTGGTLQMSAVVGPSNATNKSVVWSVIDETGSATISLSGMLTAVLDGTVTVRVVSVSAPSVHDSMVITLSNQLAESHTPLANAIAQANENKLSVVVSVDGSEYEPGTEWVIASVMSAFSNAIDVAEAIDNNVNATQVAVDGAISSLAIATIAFNSAKSDGAMILVTSIIIESEGDASTIDVLGGTLQMSASIEPANATNKSVVWSVINGTGSATISENGLLMAVSDGIVTVRVVSVSVGTVNDTKIITISNQVVVSHAELISAISNANENKFLVIVSVDGSDVGSSIEWVSQSVMDLYSDAIDAAQLVDDNVDATQNEIDNAVSVLASATLDFNNEKAFGTEIVATVDLGTSGDYAILAATGISTESSSITGDIGISPYAATYLTGFSQTDDISGEFSLSSQVEGSIYASDYAGGTPAKLSTAISDMQTAYTTALGLAPDYTELYTGDLSGKTMVSGIYKWSNNVLINNTLTLDGSSTDVWIFQISGTLTQATDVQIILSGGAKAENIFWIVADTVAVGVGAHFEGTILAMTNISMATNSSINGRLLAQTAVTLDQCTVVKP